MVKTETKTPGTAYGTGRPATGRSHPITVRVSAEALKIPAAVKNKSLTLNQLDMTKFATGRPATGRNKTITVRISEQSAEILKDVHNKSELIDKLIKYYSEHLKI